MKWLLKWKEASMSWMPTSLTTVRLLFIGWKVQQSSSEASGSGISRMHLPSSVAQMRIVASSEVETIMSLERDQAKSETPRLCPFSTRNTTGGEGTNWHTEIVPSKEQQASRCLSSLANWTFGTKEKGKWLLDVDGKDSTMSIKRLTAFQILSYFSASTGIPMPGTTHNSLSPNTITQLSKGELLGGGAALARPLNSVLNSI